MNKTAKFSLILLLLLVFSCTIQPKKIEYGKDACHFCRMNIVDQQHAAELVSNKGKAFMFDATECMIDHLEEIDAAQMELFLVADYNNPGNLMDAKKATFIISKNIPSPMGAFLSALSTKEEALNLQKSKGGKLYNWNELLQHFKNK